MPAIGEGLEREGIQDRYSPHANTIMYNVILLILFFKTKSATGHPLGPKNQEQNPRPLKKG